MIASCIVLALAFAMDCAALVMLTGPRAAMAPPVGFFLLHAASATLAACALPRLLPLQYRNAGKSGFLFFWMMSFCIPMLGLTGLAVALVPAFWNQNRPVQRQEWLRAKLATSLGSPDAQVARTAPADPCLVGVLKRAPQHGSRLRALIATLRLDAPRAVPLLRIGLLDREDDVRLLAYSLLTRKEKAFEERIGKSRCMLDDGDRDKVRAAHRWMAYDYWELASLGGSGSASTFLLDQAQWHAEAVVAEQPAEASLQLLLGRILLKKGDLQAARVALLRAAAGGIGIHKVAPFLAEVAFERGEFHQVGMLLTMGQCGRGTWPLRSICAYWQER